MQAQDYLTPRRVALVHDFLLDLRGAERVFAAMCQLWPQADIFTALYDEQGTEGRFAGRTIKTSFLQRLKPTARSFRALLPLYPLAVESFDLRGYDLVISSSSAWAHGVVVDSNAVHVCYCHNPFRYAWNERDATLAAHSPLVRGPLSLILNRWRRWDIAAAQRVDHYIANSQTTAQRIGQWFHRSASVLYPPVETARFQCGPVGDYYLILSELMVHKRIEVAIRAFNQLGRPLIVVGDGPDARHLRRLAKTNVQFLGRISDEQTAQLLQGCQALVVTAQEEFGIAAVEAQAAGRPVIALGQGGVCEHVQAGETGVFYAPSTPEALARAVVEFDPSRIDPTACIANAARFDTRCFQQQLQTLVIDTCRQERIPRPTRRPLLAQVPLALRIR